MSKFCSARWCEGHSFEFKIYKAINSFWNIMREYYVLNLAELDKWFGLSLSRKRRFMLLLC